MDNFNENEYDVEEQNVEGESKDNVEQKVEEKNGETNEILENEIDGENEVEGVEENKEEEGEIIESYDEGEEEEEDEEMSGEELQDLLIRTLAILRKRSSEKVKNTTSSFVPSLRSFLKMNMQNRTKKISEKNVHDFIRLSNAIINKKIKMDLSTYDVAYLKKIAGRNMDPRDRKIILAEDIRLHAIFQSALDILDKGIKQSRRLKIVKR